MTNEGLENLTNSIILQAVKDYRRALRSKMDIERISRGY